MKKFTIIELLVIITIITILMTLLMPALSKVKEKGRSIQCQSNQRQITSAIFTYTGDCAGYLPVNAIGSTWTSYNWSGDICENYLSGNWDIFKCASVPASWTVFNKWRPHYGYNYFMNNSAHFKDWIRIGKIETPSTVIMTTDTTEDKTDPANGFYVTAYDYYHNRHNLGINISYSDGHVAYVPKIPLNAPGYSDSEHPFYWKRWRNTF